MATLNGLIDEIDRVNEKLERMRGLLAEIHLIIDTLPDRAAQLLREPERPFAGAARLRNFCQHGFNGQCPKCDAMQTPPRS